MRMIFALNESLYSLQLYYEMQSVIMKRFILLYPCTHTYNHNEIINFISDLP